MDEVFVIVCHELTLILRCSCTNKVCKTNAVISGDPKVANLEGNHLPSCKSQTPREMERGQMRTAVKRKAEETVTSRPMKIIRRELVSGDYGELCVSDLELVLIL